jgi:hypothetical protein
MTEFILGFMVAAWLLTLVVGAYALWRYSYMPFKVMRADVQALSARQDEQAEKHNQLVDTFKKAQGFDRPRAFTDAEEAEVEAANAKRMVWR